jgi:hypothetical protein
VTQVQTISTAEPSVAPPPMIRHIVEKHPDPDRPGFFLPDYKDEALCGHLWDRLLPMRPGPVCGACADVLLRRNAT